MVFQISVGALRNRFRPALAATVALGLCLPILIGLGAWQVIRGQDKARLLQAAGAGEALAPIEFAQADAQAIADYRRVVVRGRFVADRQGLLDNQMRDGQVGYDVLTPLRMDSGPALLLVDRGWLPRGGRRSDIAPWQTPTGEVTLIGYLREPTDIPLITGAVSESFGALWVVAEISPAHLQRHLGIQIQPRLLRLAPESAHGFRRDWPLTSMPPARHYAYAVQWFGLAAALLGMYLVAGWRRGRILAGERS